MRSATKRRHRAPNDAHMGEIKGEVRRRNVDRVCQPPAGALLPVGEVVQWVIDTLRAVLAYLSNEGTKVIQDFMCLSINCTLVRDRV